ncbi:autotransporter-associated beta strand repeat-containing protein [Lysobacter sp. 2RAF19]
MNHVFRVIWSRVLGAWIVVSELAHSRTAARRTLRRAAVPSLLALACAQAHATDIWWDGGTVNGGNPAANANGGTGTWDTALTNWDNALTGGASVAWVNGDNRAFFPSNGTYTVTLGTAITAGDLQTIGGNVTLTGNTLTLTGTPVLDGAGTLTIASTLDGTSGLTKSGAGTVDLSGTKTLSGAIDVSAGTLQISGSAWNGAGPGTVTVRNGAALNLSVANALGSNTSAARLVLEGGGRINAIASAVYAYDTTLTGGAPSIANSATWNGNFVLTAPTTLTLSGGTYGGSLANTGANVLSLTTGAAGAILNGNNTYSGATTVTTQLRLASATALSPNTNVVLAGSSVGNGVIELASTNLSIALGTGAGQLQFTNTGGFRSIGGNRTVTLNGGAGLTWGSGSFVPAANTFYLGTDGASSLTFVNPIDLGSASRTIALGTGTGPLHAVMSGALSGAGGGLNVTRQAGNGVLELSGANTYTGQTSVGPLVNLIFGNANALPGGQGATGGISNLSLQGGVVLLKPSAGDFLRGTGTGASQVQWTASGGFAALGGDRTINLGGAGGVVTWNAANFVPTGSQLILGSTLADSMVTFVNPIALNGATRSLFIADGTASLDATMTGAISGAGGLQLDGSGDVRLSGVSAFTGTAFLGATAGASSSDNQNVFVSTIGNSGVNGNLGAGSTIALSAHNGSLTYTGAGESTDRAWTIGGRNTSTLSITNNGTGALTLTGAFTKDATGASNLMRFNGTYAAGTNIVDGLISESSGTLSVIFNGAFNHWKLTNDNTYSGTTTLQNMVLEVDDLANGGIASSIGDSSNAATNLVFANGNFAAPTTLRYTGAGATTDRSFRSPISSGAVFAIDASGTGALIWNGSLDGSGSSVNNLFLRGTNTGGNTFAGTLTDNNAANAWVADLIKADAGTWILSGNNNAQALGYAGNTVLNDGLLRLDSAGAITGGLGTTSIHGATGSAQRSSLVVFGNAAMGPSVNGGVLGLTAASGDFLRGLSTANTAFLSNSGTAGNADDDTYVQGVRWIGSGGFAAFGGTRTVNLGGAGAGVTWNTGGFVSTGQRLIFGDASADGTLVFANAIALASAVRDFETRDGSADIDAVLAGTLTGTTVSGVHKTGTGTLALDANNSYNGVTTIDAGRLMVGTGGATGTLGAGSVTLGNGATLAFNRNNALSVANTITGANGTLSQIGTGTTTLSAATNTVGTTQVAGGTLAVTNTLVSGALQMGAGTLTVNGTMQATGATAVAVSATAGTDSRINVNGTLRATGDLGDGNDTLDVTGTLDTGAGMLTLGDGTDTLVVHDNAVVGNVDGGLGVDTLNTNIATTAHVNALTGFETLLKTGAGVLQIGGASNFDTVFVNNGRLHVQAGGSIVGGGSGALQATVANGARLTVDGAFGCSAGDDSITVSGQVDGTGTLDQCGGDDTLTLRDGAAITMSGPISGGGQTLGDRVVLDNALAVTLGSGTVTGYEFLTKQNTGTATLTGTHVYGNGATILGGTLDVDDSLTTASIAMNNASSLHVDGTVGANAGGALALTGDGGAQAITIAAGGTLHANGTLGDGADTLDVAGTLDTGAGTLALGNGDDALIVHDGTVITGGVDAGAGIDTLTADIATTATLGTAAGFESLAKTNTGTLILAGPGTSSFNSVSIASGLLRVDAGASVVAASGALATTVSAGATLQVDGSYGCGTGADTLDIAGAITGSGNINQCGGDDTLTLHDGAVLAIASPISGGAEVTGDRLILDNASAMTLDGAPISGYELLRKQGAGVATLTGTHVYANGTTLTGGTLDVDGVLATASIDMQGATTLDIDGTVQAGTSGATPIALTGDSAVQTITVAAGGILRANGTLGDGDDRIDIAGVLDTGAGTLALGNGNDTFVVHDNTGLLGTVDAGTGADTLETDIAGTAQLGALLGFEALDKQGVGTLIIAGPVASAFDSVRVSRGTLRVGSTASVGSATMSAQVDAGATLAVDGAFGCGTGSNTLSIAGTVTGLGTIDQCGGDDLLVLADGAVLSGANPISGGGQALADTVRLDIAGAYTLDASDIIDYERLEKTGAGTATLTGSQVYAFAGVGGGTLRVDGTLGAGAINLASNTELAVTTGGRVQGASSAATVITGSAGSETITVDAGATLVANGDLGDGDDVLDVAGTLDTGGGTLLLGAGDDRVRIHDTTVLGAAIVDAGAGNDMLDVNVATTVTLGATTGFESLGKSGIGTLDVLGANTFSTVAVDAGLLHIAAAGSVQANTLTVAAGGTLGVDGTFLGTTGNDTATIAGTVSGNGTVDFGNGNDVVTLTDNASVLANGFSGGAGNDALLVNTGASKTTTIERTSGFETLQKNGTGTLVFGDQAELANVAINAGTVRVDGTVTGIAGNAFDTTLAAGATLDITGSYGCGATDDSVTVAGKVTGSGTIDQCGGNDTLRIQDGADFASFAGTIDGGADTLGDTVQLDNASGLTFGAGAVLNYENLVKTNTGTTTLTGTQTYSGSTSLQGGEVVVAGTLQTPTLAMGDDTTLSIEGIVEGLGGIAAALTGSAGANTITVGAGATLVATGTLGDGDDLLDVVGTLDTQGGAITLGDGDDTLLIHDGSVVGQVDGGAGHDTFGTDIGTSATLGAVNGFEGLAKSGAGVLHIDGPGVSDFAVVDVLAGTLDIGAAGGLQATAGGTLEVSVASGATLHVDGQLLGGAGDDTLALGGTLSGAGTVALGAGDDRLVLSDGASLERIVDGGTQTTGDTVVFDNAVDTSWNLSDVVDFEFLDKQGAATTTLTGASAFDATRVLGGTLRIDGSLTTASVALADDATLSVGGGVAGAGGAAIALTGSAGANTVVVDAGATLAASGDLGAGNDVLDVAGTLDTGAGLALGDGDDRFVVYDNTVIVGGGIDAGLGNDMLDVNVGPGFLVPLPGLAGFESLGKSGAGTLQINGPSDFLTMHVFGGVLDIAAGGSVQAATTQIDAGATLQIDGAFTGTAGDDSLVIGGTVAGAGTLTLGDGADRLTVLDGADLSGLLTATDGGAGTDLLETDIATSASLGGMLGFESLLKTGVGTLHVDGPAASAFESVNVQAGTLDIGAAGAIDGVASTTVAQGATLVVDGAFTGTANNDTMVVAGTVSGGGTISLGAGDDTLTLLDGADLSQLPNPLDGGAGLDTIDAQVQTGTVALAPTVNFEGLSKTGAGTLALAGTQAFDTVQLVGGTLDVAEGGTLTSADTFVGTGTTLEIRGAFTGIAGDDRFFAAGTVNGALDFGAGNDTVEFAQATIDAATIAGGAGNDRLLFRGMTIDAPITATGFERTELLDGSAMTLSTPMVTGTLAIDATSMLDARAGARIDGALENAGHLQVGANRLAISGDYTGSSGSLLDVFVSPGNGSAGGLEIGGNIIGTTGVRFTSDGTDAMTKKLRVIDSPNDTPGDGGFVAAEADADGLVRLDGTPWLWAFGQDQADRAWYLTTTQEEVVPEIPGVAVLHTIGGLPVRDATQRVFGRLDDARAHDDCRVQDDRDARAKAELATDCNGFWMAVSADETNVTKGRGYAFDGDINGVYIGADTQMRDTGERTLRAGWVLGYIDGNHWTDGSVAGTGPVGKGEANIRTHTPMAGFYLGNTWKNDMWADFVLSAYLHDADVFTDGSHDELRGNTLSASTNVGRKFAMGDTWTLAPEVEVGVDAVHWQDRHDFNGMDLNLADGLLGHARTAVRVERDIEMKSGMWRPWVLVGVADTIGEPTVAASVLRMDTSETMQSYANHDLGLQATVDVGVSAKLRMGATAFLSLSYAQSLEGTHVDRRGADVGVRWTW